MKKTIFLLTILCAAALWACNDDEPKFSTAEIREALSDLKGTYRGEVKVSYYQGAAIATIPDATAVSDDSLTFTLPLAPLADQIEDEIISEYLRKTGKITVKAGYEFLQMDNGTLHFVLHPRDILFPGGYGASPGITFVFSQIYGGSAEPHHRAMMFNMSVIQILANAKKYEDFKPLVYHFEGKDE
jgi:hypothetical protein